MLFPWSAHFVSFTILCSILLSTYSQAQYIEELEVNGHPGYQVGMELANTRNKVFMMVAGFDIENSNNAMSTLHGSYKPIINRLQPLGWSVVYFDYIDGSIDLAHNAENLAAFIADLDTQFAPDYELVLVGGSMGGIVARTMFAQNQDAMGVDTFITIDSPHHGVYLSKAVDKLASWVLDYKAGHQMQHGHPEHEHFYNWLTTEESTEVFRSAMDPVTTAAIALSDGERPWSMSIGQLGLHNKWFNVSSIIREQSITLNYIPYHSAIYMDDISTDKDRKGTRYQYSYRDTSSSYFDITINNPVDEHGAPEYAMAQALDIALGRTPCTQLAPCEPTPSITHLLWLLLE